jgi:transcriptional regulator with XRE-family HTH domain
MVTIGNKVKNIRKSFGLNQEDLAEYLGIDQTMISKCENGERQFTVGQLERIALLCGQTIKYFLSDTDDISPSFAFRATALTTEDLEAISDINKIAANFREMHVLLQRS